MGAGNRGCGARRTMRWHSGLCAIPIADAIEELISAASSRLRIGDMGCESGSKRRGCVYPRTATGLAWKSQKSRAATRTWLLTDAGRNSPRGLADKENNSGFVSRKAVCMPKDQFQQSKRRSRGSLRIKVRRKLSSQLDPQRKLILSYTF
mmetsp:Transcript_9122/g.27452  ORF Transcript_9122/g.27452 Transcript_9122/m.27452 type:complete len:150 (+) Transcript_9122:76-525(+)